jgi:antitoxin MazE
MFNAASGSSPAGGRRIWPIPLKQDEKSDRYHPYDIIQLCAEAAMQVSKWGDSLAVRLPKALVEKMGLRAGDELTIVDIEERTLVVGKEDRRKAAIENIRARKWTAPSGYTFDRDEANER